MYNNKKKDTIKIKLKSKLPNWVSVITTIIAEVGFFSLFCFHNSFTLDSISRLIIGLGFIFIFFIYWISESFKKDKYLSEIVIYKDCINFVYKIQDKTAEIKKINKNNIKSFDIDIKIYTNLLTQYYLWYDIYFTVKLFEGHTIKECFYNIPFNNILNIIEHGKEIPNFFYYCNNHDNHVLSINSFYLTGKKDLHLKFAQYPTTITILLGLLIILIIWGYYWFRYNYT